MPDTATGPGAASRGDFESDVGAGDGLELSVWLRLLTCSNLIERGVRQGLHQEFETTLPRFDVLAQLHRAEKPLSMGELSQRLMVTNGNVTGLVDRLAREGKVARSASADDRRVQMVSLTDDGEAQFADMARDNRTWVTLMMASLSRDEKQALFGLLGRLKQSIHDSKRITENTA
jgi:DNA-binding MarR family transcriptional regulator